jgi:hypothetical protein
VQQQQLPVGAALMQQDSVRPTTVQLDIKTLAAKQKNVITFLILPCEVVLVEEDTFE